MCYTILPPPQFFFFFFTLLGLLCYYPSLLFYLIFECYVALCTSPPDQCASVRDALLYTAPRVRREGGDGLKRMMPGTRSGNLSSKISHRFSPTMLHSVPRPLSGNCGNTDKSTTLFPQSTGRATLCRGHGVRL